MDNLTLTPLAIYQIECAVSVAIKKSHSNCTLAVTDSATNDNLAVNVSITASPENMHVTVSWLNNREEQSFTPSIGSMRSHFVKAISEFIESLLNNKKKTIHDPIQYPEHYTTHSSGIQCIDIAEHYSFNVGNAIKYIWRRKNKNNYFENLCKARWYLERAWLNCDPAIQISTDLFFQLTQVVAAEHPVIRDLLIKITTTKLFNEAAENIDKIIKNGEII